jgi:hypothetical protein
MLGDVKGMVDIMKKYLKHRDDKGFADIDDLELDRNKLDEELSNFRFQICPGRQIIKIRILGEK